MWSRSYCKTFKNVSKQEIWKLWQDVSNWPKWDPDIDYCKQDKPFAVGNHFILKPKGGPEVKIQIIEIVEGKKWADCTKFFGAKMYGIHEMEETPEGLKLTITIKVEGILRFVWTKLVAQKIVDTLPLQMENLVNLARASGPF